MATTVLERTGTPLVMPRFGTPRNPERETLGHEVGEIARRIGKPLMPWQRHAVDVALEVDPETGELFYEEVVVTVPRQCGKTYLILVLLVWRCITMARRIGVFQVATYVAQHGVAARKKLQREFIPTLRRSKSLTEVPHARYVPKKVNEWKPSMNNGSEHIYWGTGSWLQAAPPTETASHGDVLDMPVIDEAFAHTMEAGGLVEQALDAATVTRRSPQLWVISTAGNKRSAYLWRKVKAGRKACATGNHGRGAYLEWSLPDDADIDDTGVWVEYHPALGYTQTVERLLARLEKAKRFDESMSDEPKADDNDDEEAEYGYGVDGWRRGYMNQWREIPSDGDTTANPPHLDPVKWEATRRSRTPDMVPGEVVFGFDVHDGWSSIVVAGGSLAKAIVWPVEHRSGAGWLPGVLVDKAQQYRPAAIGCDGVNGANLAAVAEVREALEAAGLDPEIVKPLTTQQYKAACVGFLVAVDEGTVDRPRLEADALQAAGEVAPWRTIGDSSGCWNRQLCPRPIAPLVAATVARALLPEVKAAAEPFFLFS
jgi:hypothetical protein